MALYLLHFNAPYPGGRRPQHYLGWTSRKVEDRVLDHLNDGPHASPLVRAAVEYGLEVSLARVWPEGDRTLEAQLKKAKHSLKRLCPMCIKGLVEPDDNHLTNAGSASSFQSESESNEGRQHGT